MSMCGSYAFSGSSFSDIKKPNFVCFFDFKNPSALKNIQNLKICKKIPVQKQPKFKIFKKENS